MKLKMFSLMLMLLFVGISFAATSCEVDEDCEFWQTCVKGPLENECQLAEEFCGTHDDCEAGRYCTAEHVCAKECATDSDCKKWEVCTITKDYNECTLKEGSCYDSEDCGENEYCSLAHECTEYLPGTLGSNETAEPECTEDADCSSIEECIIHKCVLLTGHCYTNSDCETWQVCKEELDNTCASAEGKCVDEGECSAWETCTNHECVLKVGHCSTKADCAEDELCNELHECDKITASGAESIEETETKVESEVAGETTPEEPTSPTTPSTPAEPVIPTTPSAPSEPSVPATPATEPTVTYNPQEVVGISNDYVLFFTGVAALIIAGGILYSLTHKGDASSADEEQTPQKTKKKKHTKKK